MADIFVGSVAVGVVPDARGWDERMRSQVVPASDSIGQEIGNTMSRKIVDEMGKSGEESAGAFSDTFQKRLKAALEKLPKAELKGEDQDVQDKIRKIKLLLEELSHKRIGIDMDADVAMGELEVIDKELEAISHKAKGMDVKFDTAQAHAELAGLQAQMDAMDEKSKGFRFSGGAMPGMGMGIAGGIVGALPILGALGPIGGFGAAAAAGLGLAMPAIMQLHTGMTQISTDMKAYDNAQTAAARNTAAAKLTRDWAGMSVEQRRATESIRGFEEQFKQMTSVLSPQVFDLITKVLENIKLLIPTLIPLAQAGLRAISAMLDPLLAFLHSGIFTNFIQEAIRIAVPAAQAIANLLVAIVGPIIKLLTDIMPMGLRILQALVPFIGNIFSGLGQAIAIVVNEAGPAFIDLLNALGPALKDILIALGPALADLAIALARLLIPLAHVITALPPPVLRLIVDAILAIVIAVKLWGVAQLILNAALDANPIGLIILAVAALAAGIYFLATRTRFFQTIWEDMCRVTHAAWSDFINFFTGTWKVFTDFAAKVWGWIAKPFIDAFNAITQFVSRNFDPWWAANGDAVKRVWKAVWDALLTIVKVTVGPIVEVTKFMWGQIYSLFTGGASAATTVWNHMWSFMVSAARAAWSILGPFLKLQWQILIDLWNFGKTVLTQIWNVMWTIMTQVARVAWAAIQGLIKFGWDFIVAVFTVGLNLITGRWGAAWNAMKNFLAQTWNIMRNVTSVGMSAIGNIMGSVTHGISVGWSAFCNLIMNVWNSTIGWLINTIKSLTGAFDGFFGHISSGAHAAFGWIGSVGSFISHPFGLQSGGLIPGWGGGDRVPALLEPGELVLPKEAAGHPAAVAVARAYGVPGYQFGGIISAATSIGKGLWGAIQPELAGPEGQAIKIAMSQILKAIIHVLPDLLNEAATALRGVNPGNISFQRGGLVMDDGGWLPPGASTVYNLTGAPELLTNSTGRGNGGPTYHAHFDGLTGQAIEGHVQTAFQAMALRDGALHRQGRRQ